MTARPVLVVHDDKKTQRIVARVLGCTARPVVVAEDADAARRAIGGAAPVLVVAGSELYLDGGVDELVADAGHRGARGCVVLADDPPRDVPRLLGHADVDHLVATDPPARGEELAATAQKLLRADLFGIEKYLGWGVRRHERELAATTDRHRAVAELTVSVHAMGLSRRVGAQAMLIADELVANAIHAAPVDERGRRYLRDLPRDAHRELLARERPRLRWGCDARYLAIEVTDHFGSLDAATLRRHVAKATDRHATIATEGPGAGLGLAMTYAASSQLVVNLDPGYRTQILALVDLRPPRGSGRAPVPSFHLFAKGVADG